MEAADCASPAESESRALGRAAFSAAVGLEQRGVVSSDYQCICRSGVHGRVFDELVELLLVR